MSTAVPPPVARGSVRQVDKTEEDVMDARYLVLSVSDNVGTVTINRPDKGN